MTSMLKKVDVAVYDFIKAATDGHATLTGPKTYDLKANGVGYSTTGGQVDDIKSKIDAFKAKIIAGKITVPRAAAKARPDRLTGLGGTIAVRRARCRPGPWRVHRGSLACRRARTARCARSARPSEERAPSPPSSAVTAAERPDGGDRRRAARASPSGSPASSPTTTSTSPCAAAGARDRRRERRRQVDPDEDPLRDAAAGRGHDRRRRRAGARSTPRATRSRAASAWCTSTSCSPTTSPSSRTSSSGSEPTQRHRLDSARPGAASRRSRTPTASTSSPTRLVEDLGVGDRQRVEILKVLYRGARILILDEPTAVLVPQEVDELFDNLRELKAEGLTVIFISHKLDEVLERRRRDHRDPPRHHRRHRRARPTSPRASSPS